MKAKPLGVLSGTDLYPDPNIQVWTYDQEHYGDLNEYTKKMMKITR